MAPSTGSGRKPARNGGLSAAPHRGSKSSGRWTEHQVETVIGNLLRIGVVTSALVVAAGAAVFLLRHGREVPDYRIFRGEPSDLRSIGGVIGDLRDVRGKAWIQLGLLVLIATPVARVAFSVFAFERQKDWLYVGITVLVLGLLLFSLASGGE